MKHLTSSLQGEVLTLDNESMPDELLSKNPVCSKSIEEKMIEFWKKNNEKYFQYKGYSAKKYGKDKYILSTICINETDIGDNVTSGNN